MLGTVQVDNIYQLKIQVKCYCYEHYIFLFFVFIKLNNTIIEILGQFAYLNREYNW